MPLRVCSFPSTHSLSQSLQRKQGQEAAAGYRESPVINIQNFGADRSVFLTSSSPAQLCSASMRCPALANAGILAMQALNVSSTAPEAMTPRSVDGANPTVLSTSRSAA
ncbi:hypothetical protein COMA2_10349 [Candidatus Nitrospira nitrificans]|uniref:Uncharacterized protein n=1 Tax=Candidatus Nitrospira nitrificans TaxID=1742973 RepID=A0A0S4L9U8_9BACT|nr:hypothetical protein COMA2_10349 [Candidatus Nitrospira nitrificans]